MPREMGHTWRVWYIPGGWVHTWGGEYYPWKTWLAQSLLIVKPCLEFCFTESSEALLAIWNMLSCSVCVIISCRFFTFMLGYLFVQVVLFLDVSFMRRFIYIMCLVLLFESHLS